MHSDNEMVNLRSVIETLLYMVDEDRIKALEPVLVCNSKGQMTIACRMYDGKWGTQANIGKIVAWMPLPKPYGERKGE